MLERLVARIPALLVLASLVLLVQVTVVQDDEARVLVHGVPAALLLLAYLRAGRGARRTARR